jgi:hypothetical protein
VHRRSLSEPPTSETATRAIGVRGVQIRGGEIGAAGGVADLFHNFGAALLDASGDDDVRPSAANAVTIAGPELLVAPVTSAVLWSSRVPIEDPS